MVVVFREREREFPPINKFTTREIIIGCFTAPFPSAFEIKMPVLLLFFVVFIVKILLSFFTHFILLLFFSRITLDLENDSMSLKLEICLV